MRVEITTKEGTQVSDVPATESDVYKTIGQVLPNISVPNSISVTTDMGNAMFDVKQRGTFTKNGVKMPSMYVTESCNGIRGLSPSKYEDAYLTCINPESNNYKFYWLKPSYDGIRATYGRIGSERGEAFGVKDLQEPYPDRLYWIRYYEKLSKGYVDQSDVYLTKKVSKKTAVETKSDSTQDDNPKVAELYAKLKAYAKHCVAESLVNADVTEGMVKESKKLFKTLCDSKRFDTFNNRLMKLMSVSPRKCRYVNDLLAHSTKDYARIITREQDLINAMETMTVRTDGNFKGLGISVFPATDKQVEEVKRHLNNGLDSKVKNVYRVINKSQKERFDTYLKDNHIHNVKMFWHGSRNENWLSIMDNGLLIHPDAVITGKMFGYGIYFAPSAQKSWGYTSYHNTRWARGSSDTAFMGLYATAYGHPLDCTCAHQYTQSEVRNAGKDCVHAHAGSQLYNDEIIFYDERAVLMNYIVEFGD